MSQRYLRPSRATPLIYLYREPIDFRKQVNSQSIFRGELIKAW